MIDIGSIASLAGSLKTAGDIDATEPLLQSWSEAVFTLRFASEQERDASPTQGPRNVPEEFPRVGVTHGVSVGAGRQVHADASRSPHGHNRVGDLEQ